MSGNSSNLISQGEDWFADINLMDPSINNACNENIELNDLDNIRVEDFLTVGTSDVQQQAHQSNAAVVNTTYLIQPQMYSQPSQSFQTQLTFSNINSSDPKFQQGGSRSILVKLIEQKPEQVESKIQNLDSTKKPPSYPQPLITTTITEMELGHQFKPNFPNFVQTLDPLQSEAHSSESVLVKPKKPKKPQAPRKPKSKESQGSESVQMLGSQIVATQVEFVPIAKKPRAPRKYPGPRKQKVSQLIEDTSLSQVLSSNQSLLGEGGNQKLLLNQSCENSSKLIEKPPKAPRKYYPRKPKSSEVQMNPTTEKPKPPKAPRKPRVPKQPKKLQLQPDQGMPVVSTSTDSHLAVFLGSSEPTLPTSSRLTLHYEQDSVNFINQRQQGGEHIMPFSNSKGGHQMQQIFQSQQLSTNKSGKRIDMAVSETSHEQDEQTKTTLSQFNSTNLNYNQSEGLRKYGKSTSTSTQQLMFLGADAKRRYDELRSHLALYKPNSNSLTPVKSVRKKKNETSHSAVLGDDKETEFRKTGKTPLQAPLTLRQYGSSSMGSLGFGGNSNLSGKSSELPSPSPTILSTSDLTPYETDYLKRFRQNQQPNSTSEEGFSFTVGNASSSTEMTSAEMQLMNKYREDRNKPKVKKNKKEKKTSQPRLVMYPGQEPRKCTAVKVQKKATVSAKHQQLNPPQDVQVQSSQPLPFAFHSQTQIRKEGQSTYEQSISMHRPSLQLNTMTPVMTPLRPLLVQSQYHPYPTMGTTYQFPSLPSLNVLSSSLPTSSTSLPLGSSILHQKLQNQSYFSSSQTTAVNASINSVDSIISRVSSEGCSFQEPDKAHIEPVVPTAVVIPGTNSSFPYSVITESEKKPRKASTKKPKASSKISPNDDPTIGLVKLTKKGLPRKPWTPRVPKLKDQAKGESHEPKNVDGRGRERGVRQKSLGLQNWDVPQDLSLTTNFQSLDVIKPPVGLLDQLKQYKSLRDFMHVASQSPGDEVGKVVPNTTTLRGQTVILSPTQRTVSPHHLMKTSLTGMTDDSSLLSADYILQLEKLKISSSTIVPLQTQTSCGPININPVDRPEIFEYLESVNQLNFGALQKMADYATNTKLKSKARKKSTSTEGKVHPDISVSRKFKGTAENLGIPDHPLNLFQITTAKQEQHLIHCKESRKKSKLKLENLKSLGQSPRTMMKCTSVQNNTFLTANRTPKASTFPLGSTLPQTILGDFASVFPVKPLLKGMGRIPKLSVAKNKNPGYIGGQGRTNNASFQIERAMAAAGLGETPQTEKVSSGVMPTLKTKVKPEKTRHSGKQNIHHRTYGSKNSIPKVSKTKIEGRVDRKPHKIIKKTLSFDSQVYENSGRVKANISKQSTCGSQPDQHKVRQSKEDQREEQELRRGFGTNWAYSDEERTFLYSEGKYLVKREDISKKREEVDVWRVEKGFQSLKRYRPQVDYSRVFHVGEGTFVPIEKYIDVYRCYQPVYVTICIENDDYQIIQYFQAERFLPHLMFMYQNEDLYEDYYHLLQILICQVMDPKVMKEAILNKPGDKQWKHSWNITEKMLSEISSQISQHHKWNKQVLKTIRDWPKMVMSVQKVDKSRKCDACINSERVSAKRITFGGIPYERTEFFPLTESPESPKQEIQFCFVCSNMLRNWSRVVHAKNDIFGCVRQRILQLIRSIPSGDQLDPLNVRDYLMDDHIWVRRMFYDYLIVLAEAHKVIEKLVRDTYRVPNQ